MPEDASLPKMSGMIAELGLVIHHDDGLACCALSVAQFLSVKDMAWFPTFPAVLVWPLVVSLFLRMELQL
jgi:hypothetical protein